MNWEQELWLRFELMSRIVLIRYCNFCIFSWTLLGGSCKNLQIANSSTVQTELVLFAAQNDPKYGGSISIEEWFRKSGSINTSKPVYKIHAYPHGLDHSGRRIKHCVKAPAKSDTQHWHRWKQNEVPQAMWAHAFHLLLLCFNACVLLHRVSDRCYLRWRVSFVVVVFGRTMVFR